MGETLPSPIKFEIHKIIIFHSSVEFDIVKLSIVDAVGLSVLKFISRKYFVSESDVSDVNVYEWITPSVVLIFVSWISTLPFTISSYK